VKDRFLCLPKENDLWRFLFRPGKNILRMMQALAEFIDYLETYKLPINGKE